MKRCGITHGDINQIANKVARTAFNSVLRDGLENLHVLQNQSLRNESQLDEKVSSTCKVQRTTSEILSKHFTLSTKHYAIYEKINKITHYLPQTCILTYEDLRLWYGSNKVGHSLCVSLSHNYFTNFSVFIKCKECLRGEDHFDCIALQTVLIEIDLVVIKFAEKLPVSALRNYIVLQVNESGWFQIYFNFALSLVAQEMILNLFMAHFQRHDNILVDFNEEANLPFSSCYDDQQYDIVRGADFRLFPIVPDKFYDVSMIFVPSVDFSIHKPVGNVTILNNTDQDDEWIEHKSSCFLVKKLGARLTLRKTIQEAIIYLKHSSHTFTSLLFKRVEAFINLKQSIALNYDFNEEIFQQNLPPELQLIHQEVKKLILKLNKIDPCTNEYTNFLRYLATSSGAYAFYLFTIIAKYTMTKLSVNKQDLEYEIFRQTLEYFELLLMSVKDFKECEYLVAIVKSTLDLDCVIRICASIDISYWLTTIRDRILIEHWGFDTFLKDATFLAFRTSEPSSDFLMQYATLFLKKAINLCRDTHFVYIHNGVYYTETKNIHQHHIAKLMGAKLEKILCEYNTSLSDDISTDSESSNNGQNSRKRRKKPEKIEDFKKIFTDALDVVTAGAKEVPQVFNSYAYFINTKNGVFNTITGSYMAHVPCLLFNTAKKYATSFTSTETNLSLECTMSLMSMYGTLRQVLESILTNQTDLYYLAIFVPGLLCWDNLEDKCTLVFNSILKKLTNDHKTSMKMFFMLPVFQKYKYNFDKVVKYSTIVDKFYNCIQNYNDAINTIVNCLQVTDESEMLVEKNDNFDFTKVYNIDSMELLEEFLRVYPKFNPVSFCLTYVLLIFQNENNSRCLIQVEADETYQLLSHISNVDTNRHLHEFDPQEESWYRGTNCFNYERAINIVLKRQNITTISSVKKLLFTLSYQFRFDVVVLDEFLESFSMIYCPVCPRKMLQLIIGPAKCGKTEFIKQIEDAHTTSKYNNIANFILQGNSGGPAPDQIAMYSSYLVSLSEVANINASSLKAITGNEEISKRAMFNNFYMNLFPLPYIVGSSNVIPTMKDPDETIRCRIAFYKFEYTFATSNQIEYFDNPLILFENKIIHMPATPPDYSLSLSNILYVQYLRKRNRIGDIMPELLNRQSNRVMNAFLKNNNEVYCILDDLNICVHGGTSIRFSQIQELLNELPEETFTKLSRKAFEYKFKQIFQCNANDPDLYENIGFKNQIKESLDDDLLEVALGSVVKTKELLKRLMELTNNSMYESTKRIEKYTSNALFKYDPVKRLFIDVKLKT